MTLDIAFVMNAIFQILLTFTSPNITHSDFHCLQQNVYYEARNQSFDGMRAVATVTVNRIKDTRFPRTLCGVVKQRSRDICQFSWVCENKDPAIRNRNATERKAWMTSGLAAATVLFVGPLPYIKNSIYFHNHTVNPSWGRRMELVAVVDDHKFFQERKSYN